MAPTVSSIKNNIAPVSTTTNNVDRLPYALANPNGSDFDLSIQNNTQNFREELNKISKKYKIPLEELIKTANNGLKIYAKRHNTKAETIDNISAESQTRILKFLNSKLSDYVKEKNIDVNNISITGENFRKFLEDKHRQKEFESAKDGLAVFLINNKLLKLPKGKDIKTVTLDDIPENELKQAVSSFIKNAVNGINNANGDKDKIKAQMQKFEVLLRGTDDKYIDKFWDAVKEVMAEDDSVKDCITLLVKNIGSSENMKKFLTKVSAENLEALGVSKDELATAMRNVGDDPEAIEKLLKAYVQLTENGIQVERAVKEFKTKNNIPEDQALTEEQAKECFKDNPELLKIYQSFKNIKENLKAGHSGAIVGATENGFDTSNHLAELKELEQTYDVNITEDLYKEVNEYVQNHKDDLKISVEDFDKNFENAKTIAEEKVNNSNTNNFEVKEDVPNNTTDIIDERRKALNAKKENLTGENNGTPNEITIDRTLPNEESKNEVSVTTVIKKLSVRAYEYMNWKEIDYAVKNGLASMSEIMRGVAEKVSRATQDTTNKFTNYVLGISTPAVQADYASLSIGATRLLASELDEKALDLIQTNSYTKDFIKKQTEDDNKKQDKMRFGLG